MDVATAILLEVTFLEILIIIMLYAFSKYPKNEIKEKEIIIKVKPKKEEKRSFKDSKIEKKENKKILKKKKVEFERFLILLIPLAIIVYLLFSTYFGTKIDITTIISLTAGIVIVSLLIFVATTRKYKK